jgi:oligoribonuclease
MPPTYLPWLDIETTGLDPNRDGAAIFEIGGIVTDAAFRMVDRVQRIVSPPVGWSMESDFVWEMHMKSGLLDDVMRSGKAVSLERAVDDLMDFFRHYHCDGKPLAGASIGFDRKWLDVHAPDFDKFFHYRSIDTSSMRAYLELARPELTEHAPKKRDVHRTLPDLEDSIDFIRFFDRLVAP